MKDTYVAEVKYNENENDYYIEFDDEIMKSLNWQVGDTMEWIDNKDGTFTIKKKDEVNG